MLGRLLLHRGLLLTLTSRELAARYRGSLLGFFWSLVNPLLLLAVYTLVFDLVFQPKMGDARPYAVFLVCGLFPWIWLSGALLDGTSSLLANAGLIRKAVFPAEVLPMVSVLSHLVHFALALPILFAALIGSRLLGFDVGGWTVLLLPLAIAAQLPFTAGLALALAALNVHFKDVRDLLQNALTLLFFLTPILYPPSAVAHLPLVRTVIAANPVTPFVRCYQQLLFAGEVPGPGVWLQVVGLGVLAWAGGSWLFGRLEDTLVEAV
ncbi:MAG TPA: ABC transporter permease [Thermoanaerobaculia bacterium]|nr:ABC transporter permease [Thermoanaerobaculia bacterium]